MSKANSTNCSRGGEVAAYLDGELAPPDELAFETHLSKCSLCAVSLNEQKRLLCVLGTAFGGENSFALPDDFARTVAMRAESNVSGLRDKHERFRAARLAFLLILCGEIILIFGGQNAALPIIFKNSLKQTAAIGSFLLGFCYDFGFGAFVILRAVSRQVFVFPFANLLLIGLFVVSFAALSRLLFKYHRLEN